MKLDIEAMAREAGVSLSGCASSESLEAFARLIVERCAVECEGVEPETYIFGGQMHDDARATIGACEDAIRALLDPATKQTKE